MKYTVVWKRSARDELAEIWLAGADRNSVTSAIHRVERELSRRPLDTGESRDGNKRVVFEPPLFVTFEHFELDAR